MNSVPVKFFHAFLSGALTPCVWKYLKPRTDPGYDDKSGESYKPSYFLRRETTIDYDSELTGEAERAVLDGTDETFTESSGKNYQDCQVDIVEWRKLDPMTPASDAWNEKAGYLKHSFESTVISADRSLEYSNSEPGQSYEYRRRTESGLNPDVSKEEESGTEIERTEIDLDLLADRVPPVDYSNANELVVDSRHERSSKKTEHIHLPWGSIDVGDPLFGAGMLNEGNGTSTFESTEIKSVKLTEEYTDERLEADVDAVLGHIAGSGDPYPGGPVGRGIADHAWSPDHVGLAKSESRYRMKHTVNQSNLEKIVFIWSEVRYHDEVNESGDVEPGEPDFSILKQPVTEGLASGAMVATRDREVAAPTAPGFVDIPGAAILDVTSVIPLCPDPGAGNPPSGPFGTLRFHAPKERIDDTVRLVANSSDKLTVWLEEDDGSYSEIPLPYELKREEKAGPLSKKLTYLIQGITAGDVELHLEANGLAIAPSQELRIIGVDVDVDSDNNGEIADEDDGIEMDANKTGKVIVVSQDGGNGSEEAPESTVGLVEVKVCALGLEDTDEIVFRYAGASQVDGGVGDPGSFRIWKTSGEEIASTDYIVPGKTYSLSGLGLAGGVQKSFYLQTLSARVAKPEISVESHHGDTSIVDSVRVFPIQLAVCESDQVANRAPNPKRPNYKVIEKSDNQEADRNKYYNRLYIASEPDGSDQGKASVVVSHPVLTDELSDLVSVVLTNENGSVLIREPADRAGRTTMEFESGGSMYDTISYFDLAVSDDGGSSERLLVRSFERQDGLSVQVARDEDIGSALSRLALMVAPVAGGTAGEFYNTFLGVKAMPTDAVVSASKVRGIKQDPPTMIAGSEYDQANWQTTIRSFRIPDGGKASDLAENYFSHEAGYGLHAVCRDLLQANAATVWGELTSEGAVKDFEFPIAAGTQVNFYYSGINPPKYTWGDANYTGGFVKFKMRRVGNRVLAEEIRMSAAFEDYYDFDVTRDVGSFSWNAAQVEIGYEGPSRTKGRIFHTVTEVDFVFDETTGALLNGGPPVAFFNNNGFIEDGSFVTTGGGGGGGNE